MRIREHQRRAVAGVLSLLVGLTSSLHAQRDQRDPTAAGVAYSLPGTDSVDVVTDIPYKRVSTANGSTGPVDLTFDVYRSRHSSVTASLPPVIFVHGGIIPGQGPLPKVWGQFTSWGKLAAAAGYAGITFNHRMTVADDVEQGSSDVEDLVSYVRQHASDLHVDGSRMCLVFFSAGGPTSSVVFRSRPSYVKCVALFYPYLDIEHLRMDTPFRKAYSKARVDSLLRYSPAAAIEAGGQRPVPPIFIARGAKDQIPFLNASIERFVQSALRSGVDLDVFTHREGQHGFEIANRDERTRQIIESFFLFVKRNLSATI